MRKFSYKATYVTRRGNVGRANLIITAESSSHALEIGRKRVEARKSYAGKLSASASSAMRYGDAYL